LTVVVVVSHPVTHVGQVFGPVTVTVGVFGHSKLGQGTLKLEVLIMIHSGCGGQVLGLIGQYAGTSCC